MIGESQAEPLMRALGAPIDHHWRLASAEGSVATGTEAQFTLSNGVIGLSGSPAQPGDVLGARTLVAGLFDVPAGGEVPTLVPGPCWELRLFVDAQSAPIELSAPISRVLDYRRGVVLSERGSTAPGMANLRVRSLQAASLADRALVLQLTQILVDEPMVLGIEAELDVPDERVVPLKVNAPLIFAGETRAGRSFAVGSRVGLSLGTEPSRRAQTRTATTSRWQVTVTPDRPALFWRVVGLRVGDAETDPRPGARAALRRADRLGVERLLADHVSAWDARWRQSDVQIEGDDAAQAALRFATYHLIGAANPENERTSVGARGLTGLAYNGHVFWDTETFLCPFYIFTWPAAARALLMYRYHTLPRARAKAERLGGRGAFYAWESADTGDETTPSSAIGPDGRPVAILTGTDELHVNADITQAIWTYWQATGDDDFLLQAGAEMVLETARFWATRATLEADAHYHIRGVIGPDEYHENVDDNAYTNGVARWNLYRGLDVAQLLAERWPERWATLRSALQLEQDELSQWDDVARRLATGLDPRTGLVEQFEGYFGLEDIDVASFGWRTVPMDVVLGRARTQASQVIKQADVLMLMAVLPDQFGADMQRVNLDYYEPRSGHGSSLSPAVHALVAARLGDTELAARYFREAAAVDLADSMSNGAGGVHMATQGGIWQVAVLGFGGLRLRPDGLHFQPHLPETWNSLSFRSQWHGRQLRVSIERGAHTLRAVLEDGEPMTVSVGDEARLLMPGREQTWAWDPALVKVS
ncbi:MAG: glycoside hydrolase family 65 protein [Chloroflexi bacterium]|nr:glycoside hydrolase family 65 protein [Chloroflexota bacterium]